MLAEIFMLRVEMATREAARGETRAGDTGGRRQVFVANGSGTKSVRNGRIYCIAGSANVPTGFPTGRARRCGFMRTTAPEE